ncbi:MAG: potassium-transporting ATPase subunit KdpA [Candidatus Kapabacteria bacterium]|nr:potassium-transporting ATPase subunit KdpA [Candidatus Kapabacteria bacterium]
MIWQDYLQIFIFLAALIALTKPLGLLIYRIIEHKSGSGIFNKIENGIYRIIGVKSDTTMDWKTYLYSLLIFNALGFGFVFLIQLLQAYLPFNPQHLPNVEPILAFNTAVSFMTNTNWQSYAGETTLSYFVQMIGLTVQNFVSAATGIAVFLAISRGIRNRMNKDLGNFWVDLTRTTIFILLPLSIIVALVLISQGVVQNLNGYTELNTLEGAKQIIPTGPAASQIAIKQLGTNGGGFFNTNSAFPFENPTPFSNFLQMLALILIPSALTYTYGKIVGSTKQGWLLFSVMLTLFVVGLTVSLYSEYSMNHSIGIAGNMEGKETRFGITNSVIWSTATTDASNGSVNAMHESLMPLSGMVAVLNIMLGEIVFGGVGSGLYGMLIFVLLTVFIAGLMIGRTPEYLGKKIQAKEVQMAILAVIAPSFVILVFTALAVMIPQGLSSMQEPGAHGFMEILYAFTSAAGNNGSAFAGLNANTPFYNMMLGIGMLIGRFAIIIPVMIIAGSLSVKNITPVSAGTFSTDNALFGFLLTAIILIVGALTFLPALSLGPIVEHLLN